MKRLSLLLCWLAIILPAAASPGAHGPNGEHLDGPAAASQAGSIPRIETFTELYELVGHLSGSELSILIDRYDSNEPVLGGALEVEFQGMRAQAKFHADIGDYAIDDPKFLSALSRPGKHRLLFTFVAGNESDLLEGTLEVPSTAPPAHQGLAHWVYWASAAVVFLLIGAVILRRRIARTQG